MNILVIDDDADILTMVATFLRKQQLTVHTAPDALEGMKVLEQQEIQLVITDLMMPFMDGVTFAQELRKTPRTAKIPIILITAYPSDQLLESGLRKGIALTLPKPIDLNRLLTLVRFAE